MTKEEKDQIKAFVSQKFDVIVVSKENKQSIPEGNYVHVGVVGQAIYYVAQLLKEIEDAKQDKEA